MGNKTTEIRVKYENILSHDIEELVGNSFSKMLTIFF